MLLTGNEYEFKTRGPYYYRINGQVYHAISQMQPEKERKASFSKIYIFDDKQNELYHRLNSFNKLDRGLLGELRDMLKEINPFAAAYQQTGNMVRDKPTEDIRLLLRASGPAIDPHRYNLPTGTDEAVIDPMDAQYDISHGDIVVYKNSTLHPDGKYFTTISATHSIYDPLMYVLMFPFGDKGWYTTDQAEDDQITKDKKYTAMQFFKCRLIACCGFNIIQRMGRLFQQNIVDMYTKIEGARLQYIRLNQKKLRAELYQGLADAMQSSEGQIDGSQIGKKVVLPSSFTGNSRYQHQLYQDAMAIVQRFGKPDFFITFTCNPQWKEITDALLEQQTAADHPDIVARVFKLKL